MSAVVDNVAEVLEFENTKSLVSKERLVNQFVRISQFITWPVLVVLFRTIFAVRIRGQKIFSRTKGPFVIIANHTAFYDSFLFRLILGSFTPHLPLRFMAVTKFDSKGLNWLAEFGLIDFVYSLFGVFTVTPGLGIDRNIKKAKEIIRIGGNIVIYPEGRITRQDSVGPFKKGAAVLQRETNVRIIPVSFRRGERGWFRRKIFINVGEEIIIEGRRSIEDTTTIYRKVVMRLFGRG